MERNAYQHNEFVRHNEWPMRFYHVYFISGRDESSKKLPCNGSQHGSYIPDLIIRDVPACNIVIFAMTVCTFRIGCIHGQTRCLHGQTRKQLTRTIPDTRTEPTRISRKGTVATVRFYGPFKDCELSSGISKECEYWRVTCASIYSI